ncbi:hypothetical protein [Streptomyces sirii]|uniref:hypothetical protein n=1 Tax=Streptomyces sirii TaxID=3127701 RepID=UPI003D366FE0
MYTGIVRTDSAPDIDEALRRVRAGSVTSLTDEERAELSRKNAAQNKRSEDNRR